MGSSIVNLAREKFLGQIDLFGLPSWSASLHSYGHMANDISCLTGGLLLATSAWSALVAVQVMGFGQKRTLALVSQVSQVILAM